MGSQLNEVILTQTIKINIVLFLFVCVRKLEITSLSELATHIRNNFPWTMES